MRNVSDAVREKLKAQIASLESLSRDQLKTRWKDLYGIEVPIRFSNDLLMRSIAYRLQERVLGGIKPGVLRLLERVAENARTENRDEVPVPLKVLPGTIHQPPELTAQALSTRRGDLPLSWNAQIELLGFEART